MSERIHRFAVCVRNDDHEESLELRKIYEVLPDPPAESHQLIRVVDEEGEDYLYPKEWFLDQVRITSQPGNPQPRNCAAFSSS